MASTCLIGIKNTDGSLQTSFCFWKETPVSQLPILNEVYNSDEKARELVGKGYFLTLDKDPGKVKYYPDGSEFRKNHSFRDIQHLQSELSLRYRNIGYVYIWVPNYASRGEWVCAETLTHDLVPLRVTQLLEEFKRQTIKEDPDYRQFAVTLKSWLDSYFRAVRG
jgi:hypothetical protein